MSPLTAKARVESDVVVVEGSLLFHYPGLTWDLAVFLEIDRAACEQRRAARVFEYPEPDNYFDDFVWPSAEAVCAAAPAGTIFVPSGPPEATAEAVAGLVLNHVAAATAAARMRDQ